MIKAPENMPAPRASTRDHRVSHHGDSYMDPYFWLRDAGYPKVTDASILDYLQAENSYFEAVMAPYQARMDTIFDEIKGRLKDDDASVPWTEGDFDYRWAFEPEADYRRWYRRPAGSGGAWTVIFDEPKEAGSKPFFRLGGFAVSPCGRYLAYSYDGSGGERFHLFVRDLETGADHDTGLTDTSGEIVWDASSLQLYTVLLTEEWRPANVVRISRDGTTPTSIYSESDTGYFIHISATSDRRYLLIRTADHVTAEVRTLKLGTGGAAEIWRARSAGHDYTLDHDDHGWLVLSNRDQQNFSLYRAVSPTNWAPLLSGSDSRYILAFQPFKSFMAVCVRDDGLDQLLISQNADTGRDWAYLNFTESAYEAGLGHNPEFDQAHLRYSYTSMVTPASVFDMDIASGAQTLRKEQEIPSGYDRSHYKSERITVTARDGAEIPVSIVYHRDWQKGSKLHLYGYGAYGLGMAPSFSPARLSLLDRGFAYAIAHIRGGDEKGRGWYEAGKLKARTNSFNDFVDVAKALIHQGYAQGGKISTSGGSAGGELMGAVLNQAKDLFGAAVLHVPFVDVLNTMLDASLPLTPMEWPEWGNPLESAEDYRTIQAYCPYTNMAAGRWPAMMVTGGLNDPRVTYWEPAKYVAKLRTLKQDDNALVMKINMEAGHGGKSGRYDRYKEVAEEYAFVTAALAD